MDLDLTDLQSVLRWVDENHPGGEVLIGKEYPCGSVMVREMRFPVAGARIIGHTHNFDHVHYVTHGALLVQILDVDDKPIKSIVKRADAGFNWVNIDATKRHRMVALADRSIGHCIFSHRNHKGEVINEWDGWSDAYV